MGEALVAAMLVGVSFELNYHSRWVAPDAITMQFVAFTIVALIMAFRRPGAFRWLVFAAIGLGLATSTKYLAAVLAVPITLLLLIQQVSWRSYLGLAGISLLTFFLVTPGALIEPTRFLEDILYEQQHYGFGHYGFTVEAGLDHIARSARYLLLHGPSTVLWISVVFTILGLLGLVSVWREAPRLALVLCSIPLIYLTFISMQRVMFVRNLLFVMPLAAILSARGCGLLWERFPRPGARLALVLVVGVALGINSKVVLESGRAVGEWTNEVQMAQVHEYLEGESERSFQLSPLVSRNLEKEGFASLNHASSRPDEESEFLVVFQSELLQQGYWPSNDPELFVRAFGPPSANYGYYSTWPRSVVVVLERERAHEIATIYPPEGIERIFADIQHTGIANIPEGQKPSPHSKYKPGHRKGKQTGKKDEGP